MPSIRNGQLYPSADGADSVGEIPENNATLYISDGTYKNV